MSGRRAMGALHELARALDPERVVVDRERLEAYAKDESDLGLYPPDVLVLPESTEEVRRVLEVARAHRLPVTPVGARSGKSGGSLALHGGIALSLERMNRILEISPEDLVARVQPGVSSTSGYGTLASNAASNAVSGPQLYACASSVID